MSYFTVDKKGFHFCRQLDANCRKLRKETFQGAYADLHYVINNEGDAPESGRYWAKRWGWSKSETERFLTTLKEQNYVFRRPGDAPHRILASKNFGDALGDALGDTENQCQQGIEGELGDALGDGLGDVLKNSIYIIKTQDGDKQVSSKKFREWEQVFQGLDILQVIYSAADWTRSKPISKRPRTDHHRFILNWLKKEYAKLDQRNLPDRRNGQSPGAVLRGPERRKITCGECEFNEPKCNNHPRTVACDDLFSPLGAA